MDKDLNKALEILISNSTTEEKITDSWTIYIDSIITEYNNAFFWYYKNNEEIPITIENIKFHSTLDGVWTTNIYIHRVSGIPELKNEKEIEFVKLTNVDEVPKADMYLAEKILDLNSLGIVDKINLHTKYKMEELKTNIKLAASEAICLRWQEPNGSISGVITVSKER